MVLWSSSWQQAHIFIQACTYNHTIIHIQSRNFVAHGNMKHSYEKLYLLLVSAPASVQFSGLIVESLVYARATRAVYESDGWILGLCACYPCSLPDWSYLVPCSLAVKLIFKLLVSAPAAGSVQQIDCRVPGFCATCAEYRSDGWILGLCCCHLLFTKSFVKSFASGPATWQLTRQIFKMLVSAVEFSGLIVGSAVCLMVGSSCIFVLCACHPCNWPNWFSNCWSLRPRSVQFTKLIFTMLVRAPANDAVKRNDCQIPGLCACHLVFAPLHLPPMQCQIATQVLRILSLHWVHATFVVALL